MIKLDLQMEAKRPGKVLYLTNLFPTKSKPAFGTFVKVSSDAMRKLGWDVEVLALPEFGSGLVGYLRFYLRSFLSLLNFSGIVYVHYVSHSAPPAIAASLINRRLRIALHYHGSDAFPESGEGAVRRAFKSLTCRMANSAAIAVVAPSAGFLENLRNHFGLRGMFLAVSPSGGVDSTLFDRCHSRERSTDVVFAGRMIEGKGGGLAARVANAVLDAIPGTSALFVGEGPERLAMEHELQKHVASGRARFVDLLAPRDLAVSFNDSKILLFPSTRKGESLGLTWIEAGMCGVAPLILNNGVTEKLIPDELRGELVADSEETMVLLATKLLTVPARRNEIMDTLTNELRHTYSQENVAMRLDELFRELTLSSDPQQ